MLEDAARAGAADAGGAARAAAAARRAACVALDADADEIARRADDDAGARRRAGQPGLRHLHLGLHRPAEGRAGRRTRNVVRLFDATDAWFGFGADDVWTLFHSFAFDFSVWEIWGALLLRRPAGGRPVPGQPLARTTSTSCWRASG